MPRSNAGLALDACDLRIGCAERGVERVLLEIAHFRLFPRAQAAICGPSGSGKTTLLSTLAAIVRPLRGSVKWGAIDVTGLSPDASDRWRRGTLGFVFRDPHVFAGLSVLENVLLPVRFERFRLDSASTARARELIARAGVSPEARVETLSRAELRRVAVARALVNAPAIVLADEPAAGLDRAQADGLVALLSALCRDADATLIVATHDAQLAANLDERYDLIEQTLRRPRKLRLVARAA